MAKIVISALLLLGGCAATNERVPAGAPQVEYSAIGQEPGWTLRIDRDRIIYSGDYGRTRISQTRPLAEIRGVRRRYATSRLVVEIAPGECRDAMSGQGFVDGVSVTAGGRTLRGCGGERLVERQD